MWTRLGRIETGAAGSVDGVRRLADGYLAWGSYGKNENVDPPFATWFSKGGVAWERTVHAKSIVPCPGWSARPDIGSVYEPASDGRTLVFTATYLLPDDAACDRAWMISLSTTDGRSWSRSQPFGPPHDDPAWAMWAENTWAIPGGWETIVSDGSDAATIWRSTDLATWAQVASHPANSDEGPDFHVWGAAPDGTRLGMLARNMDDPQAWVLVASSDAVDWDPVRTLPPGSWVAAVVPPDAAGRPWLVAIERGDPEEARVLVSRDLVDWTRTIMAKPGVAGLTDDGVGWVDGRPVAVARDGLPRRLPARASIALHVGGRALVGQPSPLHAAAARATPRRRPRRRRGLRGRIPVEGDRYPVAVG